MAALFCRFCAAQLLLLTVHAWQPTASTKVLPNGDVAVEAGESAPARSQKRSLMRAEGQEAAAPDSNLVAAIAGSVTNLVSANLDDDLLFDTSKSADIGFDAWHEKPDEDLDLGVNLSEIIADDHLIPRTCDWGFGLRNRDDTKLGFLEHVKDGQVVCIQGDDHNFPEQQYEAMSNFWTFVFPNLTKKVKILSVQSDDPTPPARFRKHLDSDNLIAWYGWNIDDPPHPKLHPIPIGLSSAGHAKPLRDALRHLKDKKVDWESKADKVLFNYGPGAYRSTPERTALWNMSTNWSFAEHVPAPKDHPTNQDYLESISKYKFLVCPRGEGKDTHRVWEALYLGMVPIVLKSSLSPEYQNLPVIQVDKWEDLPSRWEEIQKTAAPPAIKNLERLTMSYWVNTVRADPPSAI